MTPAAVASTVKPAVRMPGVTVEAVTAVRIAIGAEMGVAVERSVSAVKVGVPVEVRPAMKITPSMSIKAAEPLVPPERSVIAAMKASPPVAVPPAFTASPRVRAKVAPMTAVVVVTPAVMVKIDPRGIVKIEIRAPVERRSEESVEPRARSDEHAAREPLRSVISIRRACIRRVRIVAVGANWSWSNVRRGAYSNCDSNAHLCVCCTCHRSR